jgi:hypothetical protein
MEEEITGRVNKYYNQEDYFKRGIRKNDSFSSIVKKREEIKTTKMNNDSSKSNKKREKSIKEKSCNV